MALSPGRKVALLELFDIIDSDKSGFISRTEAEHFGECFIRDAATHKGEVALGAKEMIAAIDENKDNQLSREEWLHYFARVIEPDLSDLDFEMFFDSLKQTVILSKNPIHWTAGFRIFFLVMLISEMACSSALIAQSVAQTDAWASIAAAASLSAPTYNTAVRLAVGALLLGNSLFGLVAGLIEMREAVTAYGVLAIALALLNAASCGLDGYVLAQGQALCQQQCTAMKISACACSYNWSLKNTLIINFICIALSSGPAAVAIFFSTSCGRSRYLNQWSDVFLQVTGVSAARRQLARSFWFHSGGDEAALLARAASRVPAADAGGNAD